MYIGVYNGKKSHDADLKNVLERSTKNGVEKIIITSGTLSDSKSALAMTKQYESMNNIFDAEVLLD
jgi:TatD DNase family protein